MQCSSVTMVDKGITQQKCHGTHLQRNRPHLGHSYQSSLPICLRTTCMLIFSVPRLRSVRERVRKQFVCVCVCVRLRNVLSAHQVMVRSRTNERSRTVREQSGPPRYTPSL